MLHCPLRSGIAAARRGLAIRIGWLIKRPDGVSAIEFAIIAPLMVSLYFGAVEFGEAISAKRKVTAVASSTADLVAQAEQVSSDDVGDIFTAASSIMTPFSLTDLSIVVTSVVADDDNKTTVDWSCAYQGSKNTKGASYKVPDGITQANSSVVVAKVTYKYTPPAARYLTGGITLNETFYLRPRKSLKVEKTTSGCPSS